MAPFSQYGPIAYGTADMETDGMHTYLDRAFLMENFVAVVRAAVPHLSDEVSYAYAREYVWCHSQLEKGATVNGHYARDTEHMGALSHEYVISVYNLHDNDAPSPDQRRAISGAFLLIFG